LRALRRESGAESDAPAESYGHHAAASV